MEDTNITGYKVSPEIQKIVKNFGVNDWIPAGMLNQSYVTIIKGVRGSGKTLFSAICMYMKWKQGLKVYHNGALKFGEELDISDLLSYTDTENGLQDCYIFIDEAQVVFDSWSGGSTFLKRLLHYVTQIRHKNVNLWLTTQFVGDLTSRLNQQVDYVITPESQKKVWTTGAKLGLTKAHKITSYYTSTENTPFGYSQNYLPTIYNAEAFYQIFSTTYMVDHSELDEYTTDKVRENIEANREFNMQQWLVKEIIPKHASKKVPLMALVNTWNEQTGDIIDSKHFAKLLKAMGITAKRKGKLQQTVIHLPSKVEDLMLTL